MKSLLFFSLSSIRLLRLNAYHYLSSSFSPSSSPSSKIDFTPSRRDIMWQSKKDFFQPKQRLSLQQSTAGNQHCCSCQCLHESKDKNNPSISGRCSESVLAHKLSRTAMANSAGSAAARFSHCSDEPSRLHSSGVKTRVLSSDTHAKDKTALNWSCCRVPGSVLTPCARRRALPTALWVSAGPTEESLLTMGTVAK